MGIRRVVVSVGIVPRGRGHFTAPIPRILFLGGDFVSAYVLKHIANRVADEVSAAGTVDAAKKLMTPLAAQAFEQEGAATLTSSTDLSSAAVRSALEVVCPTVHAHALDRSGKVAINPVAELCNSQRISCHPVTHPKSMKKAEFVLPHLRPTGSSSLPFDVALVVSFRYFIGDSYLKAMPPCINVHPSLLPKYRGASPIYSTLLSQESRGGVSVIKLVPAERMDSGDILLQRQVDIAPSEDIREYLPRILDIAAESADAALLKGNFGSLWNGAAIQEDKMPFQHDPYHAPLLQRGDSELKFKSLPASTIYGRYRAFVGGQHSKGQYPPHCVLDKRCTPVASSHADRLQKKHPNRSAAEVADMMRVRCVINEAVQVAQLDEKLQEELTAVAETKNPRPGAGYFPKSGSVGAIMCAPATEGGRGEWFVWSHMTLRNSTKQEAGTLRAGLAMKRGVVYEGLFQSVAVKDS